MRAAVVEKLPPPTKGVRPRTAGVSGVLVDAAPADIFFGVRGLRVSPYDSLLQQLSRAGAGKFLRFEDLRARASVAARAKKLNIKVLFGEQGSVLWVTLATARLEEAGQTETQPEKPSMADLVLKAIAEKRHTSGEIVSWMRSNGAGGMGITQVDGLLSGLHRAGKVKLKPLRPGSDQPERWILA